MGPWKGCEPSDQPLPRPPHALVVTIFVVYAERMLLSLGHESGEIILNIEIEKACTGRALLRLLLRAEGDS